MLPPAATTNGGVDDGGDGEDGEPAGENGHELDPEDDVGLVA